MHRFAACLFACAVSVACAQDSGPLFDQLASKDEAEAKAGHAGLVALGDAIVPEVERRLGKKPGERMASRLRAVLASIHSGGVVELLKPRFELPQAGGVPAVISPDGKHVAYAARSENGESTTYEYRVATFSKDGKPTIKTVFECSEDMRDDFMVSALQPGCWSPDSRYLGVVDLVDGRRTTRTALVDVTTSKVTNLGSGEHEMHLAVRFHPKGGQAAWVKLVNGPAPEGAVLLYDLKSGASTPATLPESFVAIDVTYLDDGRLLALGALVPEGAMNTRPDGTLCVISADGKSARVLEGSLQPDDFFWDGPPVVLRIPGTTSALCESRGPERSKSPSRIVIFDADQDGEAKELVAESHYSLVSVIDAKRACVWNRSEKVAGILSLETGEVSPLEGSRILVHRRGQRAVSLDMDTRTFSVN